MARPRTRPHRKRGERLTRGRPKRAVHADNSDYVVDGGGGGGGGGPGAPELPSRKPEPALDNNMQAEDDSKRRRTYAFRARKRVNYALPPLLEDLRAPPSRAGSGHARAKPPPSPPPRGFGWIAIGAQLSR
jgi:hypothetical protein